jgi:Zinc finger, C2H2 type
MDSLPATLVSTLAHIRGLGPPFPCHRCGRLYNHKCNLMRHLRLECGVHPRFECMWCTKKFKHRHHLRDHQRTHLHHDVKVDTTTGASGAQADSPPTARHHHD